MAFSNTSTISPQPFALISTSELSQAQEMLKKHFDAITNKQYRVAYNLWIVKPGMPSYDDFVKQYQNTIQDDISFDSQQTSLGTDDKVYITLQTKTKINDNSILDQTFHGWYIVKKVNGMWEIDSGYLLPA